MSKYGNPKISVIMPNYNCEQYISYAIRSVLEQSYTNFELIIIDDCSTDNSRDVIDSYQDPRVKKVYFQENECMYYAYNYAISIAKGEYFAIIDSDDYWSVDKLKKQLDYIELHSECGACFTLVNVVDEENTILSENDTDRVKLFEVKNKSQYEWIRHFYFKGSCLCHSSVLIRRDVLKEIGVYNLALVQIADFDLWIRITKQYNIYVMQEKLTNYRWFKSGKNFSAPSEIANRRSNVEVSYVMSRYFDDMSDELFVEVFSSNFINENAHTHEELLCERALILLQTVFYGNPGRIGGIIKLASLIQQESTRKILRERYGITQKYIYELTVSPLLYDSAVEEKIKYNKEQQNYIIQLEKGQKNQQEYIANLERNLKSQDQYVHELEEKQKSQQEYISNLERDLKSQNQYVQGVEEKQRNQQEYIDNLERDLKSQNQYVQGLEEKQRNQQEYIDNLERDLKSQNQYVQGVEEKQQNQQEYIDNLERDLKSQSQYVQGLEEKQQNQQEYIDNLERDLKSQNQYVQKFEEKQRKQQEYIGNLERDLKSQNQYAQELKITLNQLEEHMEQREEENNILKLQIEDKEKEIAKIEAIYLEYQGSIRNLQETLLVQKKHIKNLENEIESYINLHKTN